MSALRAANLRRLGEETFDVLVVGGGINGAVSAACLAARGARVALIDRGDFASVTSQQSSNLAWGGIKYLESFELGLVRKLCLSRNHLIASYPSSVREIRFFTVHDRGFRHGRFKLFLGALLYWLIGNFFTRAPRLLSRAVIAGEEPVVEPSRTDGGIEYSDAYLPDNDARFVWTFVRVALDAGCAAANYVESLGSRREGDLWVTRARETSGGGEEAREITIRSRVLVNACGPYVDAMNERSNVPSTHRHLLSKGIHLIVPRLADQRRVLTFFADDGRLFFVIPMGPRTCIGTTDTRVDAPEVGVTDEDRRFVLDNINKRLRLPKPLTPADVIAERCGVRPLVVSTADGGRKKKGDWTQLSRKHVVEVDEGARHVAIFGGKLTDCLNVGEEICDVVRALEVDVPRPEARWYGEPPEEERRAFFAEAEKLGLSVATADGDAGDPSEAAAARLWRRYGKGAGEALDLVRRDPAAAEMLVAPAGYLRCEVTIAARDEMIVKLEDLLRRRSNVALVVARDELATAPAVRDACRTLFGDDADARFDEYFAGATARSR